MNKKISLPIIIVSSLLLGFYIGYIKAKKSEMSISDMYIQKQKEVKRSSNMQYEFEGPLIIVNSREFTFLDLPLQTQKTIIGESIEYRQRLNEILKGFGVQYMVAITRNPNQEVDSSVFTDIVSFYDGIVTDQEVEDVYNKNIKVFPVGHDKKLTLGKIKVQMIVNKITEFTNMEGAKYLSTGQLVYKIKNPPLPSAWLKYENAPVLKFSDDAKIKIKLVMNYSCEKCGNLQKDLGELLEKYDPKKLEITLLHYSNKHLDTSYYFNKAILCLRDQSETAFWKLNLELLGRTKEISLLKEDDLDKSREILEQILKSGTFADVNQEKIFECVKDETSGNKNRKYLLTIQNDFQYLTRLPFPLVFINDTRIEYSSGSLLQAVENFVN